MNTTMLIAVIAGVGLVALALVAIRFHLKVRGERLVTCPETKEPAAVELSSAPPAALHALLGGAPLELRSCSRWPEKAGCGQECLAEIETAPDGCLVRSIVSRWYRDKVCALCGRRFGEIPWEVHRPGLLDGDRKPVEWGALRLESLPKIVATHAPLCWDCLVTETLRQQRPELITYRGGGEDSGPAKAAPKP
jgi:hypothetical protein